MIFNQLVEDIRDEPSLWSLKSRPNAEDQENAWRRIASKNKLSAVEVKLIFRELSKKYKEECKKPKSTWKLLQALRFLDEDLEDKSDKLKASAPQITSQATVPPPPELPDDIKVKEEPKEHIPLGINKSEDDYVELLEVRDEDYTDEEEEDDNMMDLDEDLNTNNSKQNALYPVKPSQSSQNKSLSVLTPSVINNSNAKPDEPIASRSPSTSTNKSVTTTIAYNKIPAMFSGVKRKLANGTDSHTNGSGNTQPPEKQSKIIQDNMEPGRNSPLQSIITPLNPKSKQITSTPKEIKSIPPISVRTPQSLSEIGNLPVESKMSSVETVRLESNGLNIGDVIPMPDIQSIKVERAEVDSILGRTVQTDHRQSTPHSRMYDSFGQYVSNTLTALPDKLANKLEIKILEAIIAINTEKSNLA